MAEPHAICPAETPQNLFAIKKAVYPKNAQEKKARTPKIMTNKNHRKPKVSNIIL
jgi:hypothetical protein